MAYWAEGGKRSSQLEFINSDPGLVNLFIIWAATFLEVSSDRFTINLHLHDGQGDRERRAYWSTSTGLSPDQFRKTSFKPDGSGHRKNKLYQGMALIRVNQSADLLQRVLGWIEWLQETYLSSLNCLAGR